VERKKEREKKQLDGEVMTSNAQNAVGEETAQIAEVNNVFMFMDCILNCS